MRYLSARQMIFDAYHTRKGDSPAAAYFDRAQKLGDAVGNNGAKLRSLIAEHKRNMRALSHAGPFDENLDQLKMAVRRTEKRLSEIRTALEDTTKSSNEGRLPDNDWKIVHGLECGQVIAAVERQPEHLQAVARLFWGPFTPEELAADRELVHTALLQSMQGRRLPGQGQSSHPPAEAWRTLTALVWAAIHHHGEATYPYNRPGLSGPRAIKSWLEGECGKTIDVGRWSRSGRVSWAETWQYLLTTLDEWESRTLAPVAGLIQRAA